MYKVQLPFGEQLMNGKNNVNLTQHVSKSFSHVMALVPTLKA